MWTVVYISICVLRLLKEELAWAIDKQLWTTVQLTSKFTKKCVMRCALRNFEDKSRVGLVRHKKYTTRERLLMS